MLFRSNDTATTEIYTRRNTLSLHDALPISWVDWRPDDAWLDVYDFTKTALRLRRNHPDWFADSYTPLAAEGPAAGHAFAFLRGGHAVTVVTRLPGGLRQRGGWAGTELVLPEMPFRPAGLAGPAAAGHAQAWRDVLTGAVHDGPRIPLARLLTRLPVALLVPAPQSG